MTDNHRNGPAARPVPRVAARSRSTGATLGLPAVTAAQLEKHAKRFGPGQVRETAAELGLTVKVEAPPKKKQASGPTLKQRITDLIDDGHSVEVIAEMEDLTPARARRLVAELTPKEEETDE